MKSLFSIVVVATASLALLLSGMEVAEAKRLGGGLSFGSKFSQSQSLKRQPTQPQKASPSQQNNSERKQLLSKQGGFAGMLGALAIGGLLGALFFGGVFEGINFMDVFLFGLIAFLLFKFLARRSQQSEPVVAGAYNQQNLGHQNQSLNKYGKTTDDDAQSINDLRSGAPNEFDQDTFLDGAKKCFARLQRAWDEGDLADIRQFTTDHVFGEIQDQFHARKEHNNTVIANLEAELLGTSNPGLKQEAIVLFKAQLLEDEKTIHVEEVWHFTKPVNNLHPTWYLDGIQQVEG